MNDKKESIWIKIKDILLNFRVWILIIFLLASFFAISPSFSKDGVVISGVTPGLLASQNGFEFDTTASLRNLERLISVNGEYITDEKQFYEVVDSLPINTSILFETEKQIYNIIFSSSNESLSSQLGLSVRNAPNSNVRLGIELEGGSRLILSPQENLTESDFDLLINTLQSRLDVFGASGTKVNKLEDAFSNEKYIIVESTSSNKNDVFELIQRQGIFEAKIKNTTVFTGDDVLRVFNDPQRAGLQRCSPTVDGHQCVFAFTIEISPAAADAFFNVTKDLNIVGGSLSEPITFILDGREITSLSVSSSFKYQRIYTPQISVSGSSMPTVEAAQRDGLREMKFLQTILNTQSLQTDLVVVQSYSISSSLGEELLKNSVVVGIFSLLIVAGIVALRYRKIEIFVAIIIALLAEVFIVFGAAAFLKLSIDLAAIGGLIAAIGTGVDDQIIITDEYFKKRKKKTTSKKKIKAALYIIMIAYLTTLAAMIPLYFAGLKVLQGFAFMIIIGVTVGVFITRPAYAVMLRILMTTRKQREEERQQELEEEKNS